MSQPSEVSSPVKLPPEIVGEILSRVPTKSLARFRAVCKQWNKTIWEDKSFVNNYLSHTRPQFILRNKSHMCSVEINLDDDNDHVSPIEVRELTLDLPCGVHTITSLVYCDGFLLSGIWKKGFVLWNPLVEHTRWIMSNTHDYRFCGVGYDKTRPESGYKIFGYDFRFDATCTKLYPKVVIYDCKTDAWKFVSAPCEEDWYVPKLDSIVSMNGNLYWISYDSKTCEHYIRCFDFSKEIFETFCVIPSNNDEDLIYTQVLAVFRRDRFSLLRQSYMSNKVEILVTKNKIDGNGEAVEWRNLMIVSIPNFPRLHQCHDSQPSYFIDSVDDKKLVVCTCDEKGRACIYIVKGDVFRKILIDVLVDVWPSHLTYVPSFVSVPNSSQRKEERLQKKEVLVKFTSLS